MERRLLLALAISFLIMLAYNAYLRRFAPVPRTRPSGGLPEATSDTEKTWTPEIEKAETGGEDITPIATETSGPAEAKEIVETEKYVLTVSNRGGSISEIALKEYHGDPAGEEPFLLSSAEDPVDYGLALSLMGRGDRLSALAWAMEKKTGGLVFTRAVGDNLLISKSYSFYSDRYGVDLTVVFTNNAESPERLSYRIGSGTLAGNESALARRFVEVSALAGEEILRKPEEIRGARNLSWICLRDRHFSLVLAPDPAVKLSGGYLPVRRKWGKGNKSSAGLEVAEFTVPPQKTVEHKFLLYAGPNDERVLKTFGAGLERVVDFGKLDKICRLLLRLLRGIRARVNNYGVAIILLTILVNLVLFPLTRYNQLSMRRTQAKMQPLQPQLTQIRERYRDNPQKLQQETMELYRKHGISPLGMGCGAKGCLTMFLQIPVFISLYLVLMKTVELRGAAFLWIKDLSMPDSAFQLPFVLPVLKTRAVNVLPLLTGAAMVLQQKLTAAGQGGPMGGQMMLDEHQKQQQKMMSVLFAVLFTFLFYNFPAGFNLYILTNMVCMAAVQLSLRGKELIPQGAG